MYCTGKASGWFFRHEMSDLFFFLQMGSRLDVKAVYHVFVYYQAVDMTNYRINDVDASVCIFQYEPMF